MSATNKASIVIGIDDLVHDQSTLIHLTPLKQIELGTNVAQVICMDKHILVQNNHRDSVACVEPSTAISLETRGWAPSTSFCFNLKLKIRCGIKK